jgi:prepilin-type processing-associated H-X9-DG protein/prepilin-type N-terminal cleavage/methylation domain-containing protein
MLEKTLSRKESTPAEGKRRVGGGHTGFTLIEILVVVAILALLVAILFPVFSRARENARKASCQNNLKQIALGFTQYMQDYDGRFPHAWDIAPADFGIKPYSGGRPAYVTSPSDAPIVWPAKLEPYLKSRQIFNCPSRTRNVGASCGVTPFNYAVNMQWKDGDPVVGAAMVDNYYGASVIGYGYNVTYLGGGQFPADNVTSRDSALPTAANCYTCGVGALETEIQKPSETVLLIDNNFGNRGASIAPAFASISSNFDAAGELWCRGDGTTFDKQDSVEIRHNGGINVAFVDGHVKWMKKEAAVYRPINGAILGDMANYANDDKFLWDRF